MEYTSDTFLLCILITTDALRCLSVSHVLSFPSASHIGLYSKTSPIIFHKPQINTTNAMFLFIYFLTDRKSHGALKPWCSDLFTYGCTCFPNVRTSRATAHPCYCAKSMPTTAWTEHPDIKAVLSHCTLLADRNQVSIILSQGWSVFCICIDSLRLKRISQHAFLLWCHVCTVGLAYAP